MILNGALTAWIWLGEKGIVFSGARKEKSTGQTSSLQLYSRPPHRKYEPIYRLEVIWTYGAAEKPKTIEVTAPFTKFFAADGYFVPAAFEIWLREAIPGLGDPAAATGIQKVEGGSKAPEQPKAQPTSVAVQDEEDDDVVLVGSELSQGGAQTSARNGGSTPAGKKRSKRKA